MKQIKMCVICKYEIVEKLDRYVRLTDYEKGYKTGEVYYHLSCWKTQSEKLIISDNCPNILWL